MSDELTKEIGARLRLERQRLRLSQSSIADAGGVAKATQIGYEQGARMPSAGYLHGVAVVGVDIGYVVLGTNALTQLSSKDWEIVMSIADVIAQWARTLQAEPSLETRAHLASVFFNQYRATGAVDIENYKMTLSYIHSAPADTESPPT